MCNLGVEQIAAWEAELLAYATDRLLEIPRLVGELEEQGSRRGADPRS